MPIYEVRSLDCHGNPADGYTVNDTRRIGEIYLSHQLQPDGFDQFVIRTLIDAKILSEKALEVPGVSTLVEDQGDYLEVTELESAYVALSDDPEVDRDPRYLEMADTRNAQRLAERNLNELETLGEIDGYRPILHLEPQIIHGGGPTADRTVFWRTEVFFPLFRGRSLHIVLGYDTNPPGGDRLVERLGVEVFVIHDGKPVASDRFEWDLADWQKNPSFGFDPMTSEELTPTKKQLKEILVALDEALEKP